MEKMTARSDELTGRYSLLLRANPTRDRRPVVLQGAGAHEKPDMAALHGFLGDTIFRRPDIFCRVEHLLGRGDVVVGAGKQIRWTGDVAQIQRPAQPDKLALG